MSILTNDAIVKLAALAVMCHDTDDFIEATKAGDEVLKKHGCYNPIICKKVTIELVSICKKLNENDLKPKA